MKKELPNRREFTKSLVAAGMTAALSRYAFSQEEKARPAEGKKALFVYGGWKGHEPEKCRDIFCPWLTAQGFDLEISDTLDAYLDGLSSMVSPRFVTVGEAGVLFDRPPAASNAGPACRRTRVWLITWRPRLQVETSVYDDCGAFDSHRDTEGTEKSDVR